MQEIESESAWHEEIASMQQFFGELAISLE